MKKLCLIVVAILGFFSSSIAQSGFGSIAGKIIDDGNKKPIAYAKVIATLNGIQKGTALSDDEGDFELKGLAAGTYDIKIIYSGYPETTFEDIQVLGDKIKNVTVAIKKSTEKILGPIKVRAQKSLIDADDPTQNNIGGLNKKPTTNVNTIAGVFRGVETRGGGTPNIRGARPEGTAYYIDGVRVQANAINLPANAIENIEVISGGTPASYGDFIGGAISATTKSPTRFSIKQIELRTASPFFGYLDNSHVNQLEGVFTGPLMFKDKNRGNKERVVLGYLTSIRFGYNLDGRLPAVDLYKVKDSKLAELEERPLRAVSNGTLVPAAEFLTKNDLEKVGYRQNVEGYSATLQGTFNYQPTQNINIKLGYQALYSTGRNGNTFNSLMNYKNNGLSEGYGILTYLQFTQFFKKSNTSDDESGKKEEAEKPKVINDALYTIRLSYERNFSETMDANHKRELFNYGYIGNYKTYKAPSYEVVRKSFGAAPDSFLLDNGNHIYLTTYYKQNGYRDTALRFEQSPTLNRIRGNYTRQIIDYFGEKSINSLGTLRGLGGLANGDEPNSQISIYSQMWGNVGNLQAGYSKSLSETFIMFAQTEASLAPKRNPKAKHNMQFGLTYEQRFQRGYSLSSDALWILMRQLANSQMPGNGNSMDSSKYILKFDANGVFQDTVNYQRLVKLSEQSNFDKRLREKLIASNATDVNGNPITENSFIDVNSFGPGTYSLNMFTADELLNNGNSYVSYFGYDHLGNLVSSDPGVNGINQFFKNRVIPAYQPVYFAAWLQDKFVFKDLIVRLGVRMERFDANQAVLKDPYSMVPIYTVGEVRKSNLKGLGDAIPTNVGNDYKVYVNQMPDQQAGNTLKIVGYRNGNFWFDKDGNPLDRPDAIYRSTTNTSRNTPFLVDPKNPNTPTRESFEDYEPDVKLLPRIWFSFPISTTAQFFGTYDILTQRPGTNVAQIDDYYYLGNRLTGAIANPNLKMTQVTDYEIGFRQQVAKDAALGIIASYREYRNLVQLFRYNQAWPYDYTTVGNLDFSTVKSIGLEYKLRELGNVELEANYQLQFADGTGSNATTSSALINTGLSTLRTVFPLDFDTRHTFKAIFDFHYKDDKKYNGPVVNGKKILENSGFNFIFTSYSGRPYTQTTNATSDGVQSGGVVRTQVKGSPNGANLPPQFNLDFTADKNITFKRKLMNDNTKEYRLRIFVTITNLFNVANVASVFRFTGSAYDDGYLSSPAAQDFINSATNRQSFIDLYNTRMVNPDRFLLPRLTRLGLQLSF